MISILVLALLMGCPGTDDDDTVNVYGYMVVGHELGDPPLVLSGAHLDAYDDAGELLAEGTEPYDDTPGYYRVRGVPREAHVNLIAWNEGSPDVGDDDDDTAGDDDHGLGEREPGKIEVREVDAEGMSARGPVALKDYFG